MKTIIPSLLASLLMVCSLSSRADELHLEADISNSFEFTLQKSPVLYFYLSHATSLPIHFTLVDIGGTLPVAEVLLRSPAGPGFVAIRLKDHNIVLDEEVQYRWFVTVIQHAYSPQQGIVVATGMIERIDPREINYYDRPCAKDSVVGTLVADLWVDAFACVNELIGANPDDRAFRDLRDVVLANRRRGDFIDRMSTGPR